MQLRQQLFIKKTTIICFLFGQFLFFHPAFATHVGNTPTHCCQGINGSPGAEREIGNGFPSWGGANGCQQNCPYSCQSFCGANTSALPPTPATSPTIESTIQPPNLSIQIPGFKFTNIIKKTVGNQTEIDIPFLADYIAGVYNYAISIAAVVAGIMILIGGLQYLTAGDSGRVGEAKERITNAVLGLLLALSTYLILQTINPKTTTLKAIQIVQIKSVPFEFAEGGDTENDIDPGPYAAPNIYCPKTGGTPQEIKRVLDSLIGKVTYRFNGKGQPPPYKETKPNFTKYNNDCPTGTLCLDCSGFVNFVLTCAGAKAPGGGTGSMFQNAEKITKWDPSTNSVNGTPLKDGDLVGYKAGENPPGKSVGHVLMFVGGFFYESRGGDEGRQPGANPVKNNSIAPSAVQWVKRISP